MAFPDTGPDEPTRLVTGAPDIGASARQSFVPGMRRGWGPVFLLMGGLLAAWTTWLTVRLPENHLVRSWDVAWGGFDVLLTAMFVATGVALLRGSSWVRACALATATLLVVDAWFDITTAQRGEQLTQAIFQAVLIELPVAVLCVYVAWRSDRALRRGSG